MDYSKESLVKHLQWKGKIEVIPRVKLENVDDLSLAYTPGVDAPCLEIQKDISKSFEYTRRYNTVAVITDGSAVLGLGDIGPEAGMPVMEGKCALFKTFGDVDAIPLCVKTKNVDEFVNTVYLLSGSFGGINLEDISAPRCFEIERRLIEKCDIPIFHDDQHGTAIVLLSGLINALKITGKKKEDIKIVMCGAGAAGIAICKLLLAYGCKNIIMTDKYGVVYKNRPENKIGFDNKIINTEENYFVENNNKINFILDEIAEKTNLSNEKGVLKDVIVGADVFIGVSAPGVLTKEMVKTMNKNAIIFACANPTPEIMPEDAKEAGARIIATGRSDYPNQLNNLLAFPGVFRGLLDAKVKHVTENMKLAASMALANYIKDSELNENNIIPKPLDKNVAKIVSEAVKNVN